MRILFLHGWHSVVGGVKPTYLKDAGHEVLNPALDDDDFDVAVRTAQAEYDQHQPDVIVGSSRGGAVAMNIGSKNTPLILLCPAWKNWGTVTKLKPNSVILHSRADDVIPFSDSEELVTQSGLPPETLIEVGDDHRLADPEPLKAMLDACEHFAKSFNSGIRSKATPSPQDAEYHAFISTVHNEIVPWIERRTIPFFHVEKDVKTNTHENGIIAKDRTGVFVRIAGKHYILTAAHHIDELIANEMYLYVSLDDENNLPIPITKDEIAVSDPSTLDIAAIRLLDETANKLLKRHTPLSLQEMPADCRGSDGFFLIVGYPRAGAEFVVEKWNAPHSIKAESLKFLSTKRLNEWKHDKLQYSPKMHIVVNMSQKAVSGTTGEETDLPDHKGIEGISGCGIWFIADRKKNKRLSEFGVNDCKLIAIEHSYDEAASRVAGTWIDLALAFLVLNFPETREPMKLVYPQSPAIWTPQK